MDFYNKALEDSDTLRNIIKEKIKEKFGDKVDNYDVKVADELRSLEGEYEDSVRKCFDDMDKIVNMINIESGMHTHSKELFEALIKEFFVKFKELEGKVL